MFTFDGVDAEQVKIVIDDLEYDKLEKKISLNDLSSGSGFILHKSATEIEEVAMVKQKPVVKRKIDRLEFNVENSNISSLNGWEILKKHRELYFPMMLLRLKGVQLFW